MTHGAKATPDSQWYFDGLRNGELLLPRCSACHQWARPSTQHCSHCGGSDLPPTRSSGQGTVVCTIRDHSGEQITTLGLVEMGEGPWIAAEIFSPAHGNRPPVAGDTVITEVVSFADGEPVPAFRVTPPAS